MIQLLDWDFLVHKNHPAIKGYVHWTPQISTLVFPCQMPRKRPGSIALKRSSMWPWNMSIFLSTTSCWTRGTGRLTIFGGDEDEWLPAILGLTRVRFWAITIYVMREKVSQFVGHPGMLSDFLLLDKSRYLLVLFSVFSAVDITCILFEYIIASTGDSRRMFKSGYRPWKKMAMFSNVMNPGTLRQESKLPESSGSETNFEKHLESPTPYETQVLWNLGLF